MQGVMFGADGPVMEGTWYNLSTGDQFTVRDTFFEDNELIVQTMDGRMLKYSTIQNYVKTDKPIDTTQIKQQHQMNNLPPEVAGILETETPTGDYDALLAEDMSLIQGQSSLGNIYKPQDDAIALPIDTNKVIIEKALAKCGLPDLNISTEWEMPEKAIDMLINIMDIKVDDIVMWYLDNLDLGIIANKVKDCIATTITSKFGVVE